MKMVILLTMMMLFLYRSEEKLTDIDGNTYSTVKINNTEWMCENLKVSHFLNGDRIPEARSEAEWEKAGTNGNPVWCYYDNDPANGEKYGKLYNWYAITDPRGLAPEGWHIPDGTDWTGLMVFCGGIENAGYRMKCADGWNGGKANNAVGFSGLPGGCRHPGGEFSGWGCHAQWWSLSSEVRGGKFIYSICLKDSNTEAMFVKEEKTMGMSVRCYRKI